MFPLGLGVLAINSSECTQFKVWLGGNDRPLL